MDHTFVDAKSLKTLEDLIFHLGESKASLTTLYNYQKRAIEIGIMKEDMNERANTILWDIERLIKLYENQMVSVFELLPSTFNPEEVMKKLIAIHNKKAKSLIKEAKQKCDT